MSGLPSSPRSLFQRRLRLFQPEAHVHLAVHRRRGGEVLLRLLTLARVIKPVTFPPGRAKLAKNPVSTGSLPVIVTIGIVPVTFLTTWVVVAPAITMTSTLSRTSSAATSGRRLRRSTVDRSSKVMFLPSIQPSSRRPWRSASKNGGDSAEPSAKSATRDPGVGATRAAL